MKIRHIAPHSANAEIIFPEIGKQKLDGNGEIEVPDEVGAQLVASKGSGWIDTEAVEEIKEEQEPTEGAEDTEKEQNSANSTAETGQLIALVENMGHPELLETAKTANVKGVSLFSKPEKVEVLRKLVINTIKKQSEQPS